MNQSLSVQFQQLMWATRILRQTVHHDLEPTALRMTLSVTHYYCVQISVAPCGSVRRVRMGAKTAHYMRHAHLSACIGACPTGRIAVEFH
jgi:hypothetical protein